MNCQHNPQSVELTQAGIYKTGSSVRVHGSESVTGVPCLGGYWQEAERALALLIAASCSAASAAVVASPRAPATLRYLARLRAAISSASSICLYRIVLPVLILIHC